MDASFGSAPTAPTFCASCTAILLLIGAGRGAAPSVHGGDLEMLPSSTPPYPSRAAHGPSAQHRFGVLGSWPPRQQVGLHGEPNTFLAAPQQREGQDSDHSTANVGVVKGRWQLPRAPSPPHKDQPPRGSSGLSHSAQPYITPGAAGHQDAVQRAMGHSPSVQLQDPAGE